jgi:hypothetical protein
VEAWLRAAGGDDEAAAAAAAAAVQQLVDSSTPRSMGALFKALVIRDVRTRTGAGAGNVLRKEKGNGTGVALGAKRLWGRG